MSTCLGWMGGWTMKCPAATILYTYRSAVTMATPQQSYIVMIQVRRLRIIFWCHTPLLMHYFRRSLVWQIVDQNSVVVPSRWWYSWPAMSVSRYSGSYGRRTWPSCLRSRIIGSVHCKPSRRTYDKQQLRFNVGRVLKNRSSILHPASRPLTHLSLLALPTWWPLRP